MTLLLDFDGVLITTPSWQPATIAADGFIEFNPKCVTHIKRIISLGAVDTIVLTTTHRIRYSTEAWQKLFAGRGIATEKLEKVNSCDSLTTMLLRRDEIAAWAEEKAPNDYIILDDDNGLQALPAHIKQRWVRTDSLIGLNEQKCNAALNLTSQ